MASRLRRMFRGSTSHHSTTTNTREALSIPNNGQNNSGWTLPTQNMEEIYQIGTFDFKTALAIKDHEQTISIKNEYEEIKLLSSLSIERFKNQGYNYIHYGLIQIAIKPLTKLGIDTPVLLCLRDQTMLKYKDSLLAIVQSNLCNGPIYFNCAPNFSVDLNDPTILNTLVLNVHLPGLAHQENRRGFLILYRIYFKLLTSQFNPKCLIQTPPGETIVLQVEAEHAATFTPKLLKWNEITLPQDWQVTRSQPPRNITRREVNNISETPEGNIILNFCQPQTYLPRSLSYNQARTPSIISDYEHYRNNSEPARRSINIENYSENSRNDYENIRPSTNNQYQSTYSHDTRNIESRNPIPEIITQPTPQSPTLSEMQTINVISIEREFNPDMDMLRKDFMLEKYNSIRNWFFNTFTKEQTEEYRSTWKQTMNLLKRNLPFFEWFLPYIRNIHQLDKNILQIDKNKNLWNNAQTKSNMKKDNLTKQKIYQSDINSQLNKNMIYTLDINTDKIKDKWEKITLEDNEDEEEEITLEDNEDEEEEITFETSLHSRSKPTKIGSIRELYTSPIVESIMLTPSAQQRKIFLDKLTKKINDLTKSPKQKDNLTINTLSTCPTKINQNKIQTYQKETSIEDIKQKSTPSTSNNSEYIKTPFVISKSQTITESSLPSAQVTKIKENPQDNFLIPLNPSKENKKNLLKTKCWKCKESGHKSKHCKQTLENKSDIVTTSEFKQNSSEKEIIKDVNQLNQVIFSLSINHKFYQLILTRHYDNNFQNTYNIKFNTISANTNLYFSSMNDYFIFAQQDLPKQICSTPIPDYSVENKINLETKLNNITLTNNKQLNLIKDKNFQLNPTWIINYQISPRNIIKITIQSNYQNYYKVRYDNILSNNKLVNSFIQNYFISQKELIKQRYKFVKQEYKTHILKNFTEISKQLQITNNILNQQIYNETSNTKLILFRDTEIEKEKQSQNNSLNPTKKLQLPPKQNKSQIYQKIFKIKNKEKRNIFEQYKKLRTWHNNKKQSYKKQILAQQISKQIRNIQLSKNYKQNKSKPKLFLKFSRYLNKYLKYPQNLIPPKHSNPISKKFYLQKEFKNPFNFKFKTIKLNYKHTKIQPIKVKHLNNKNLESIIHQGNKDFIPKLDTKNLISPLQLKICKINIDKNIQDIRPDTKYSVSRTLPSHPSNYVFHINKRAFCISKTQNDFVHHFIYQHMHILLRKDIKDFTSVRWQTYFDIGQVMTSHIFDILIKEFLQEAMSSKGKEKDILPPYTPAKQPLKQSARDYAMSKPQILPTPNRYSTLQEYPPLSFKEAVAPTSSSTQPGPTSNDNQYITKPLKLHVALTSYYQKPLLNDLITLTNKMFYPNCLYQTADIFKTQQYYELILIDSSSVEIKHHRNSRDNTIAFSTIKIKHVKLPQDIGLNTWDTKPFSIHYQPNGYNYQDYKEAWFNAFYLRSYTHSWFIRFDKTCPKPLPIWFTEWWIYFGSLPVLYPSGVNNARMHYEELYKDIFLPHRVIHFHIDYEVPWILSWYFTFHQYYEDLPLTIQDIPLSLVREFRIKWWDKFDYVLINYTQIDADYKKKQALVQTVKIASKILPTTPTHYIPAIPIEPSTSRHKSRSSQGVKSPTLSVSSKRSGRSTQAKKKMEAQQAQLDTMMVQMTQMHQQLAKQAQDFKTQWADISDDEPASDSSTQSPSHTVSPKQPYTSGYAQDPFSL